MVAAPAPVFAKSATLALAVVLVKTTVEPEAAPVVHPVSVLEANAAATVAAVAPPPGAVKVVPARITVAPAAKFENVTEAFSVIPAWLLERDKDVNAFDLMKPES